MAESEEKLRAFWWGWKKRVKELAWNSTFKKPRCGIWSHHFMANRWGKSQTVTDFLFFCSKITVNVDCSHAVKRHLLLGRKAMTNIDSVLKSADITLTTKVNLVKPMLRYESWTIKRAEHWRTDAFVLWCWRWLLRVPWIARRSSQSILKGISPEHSLKALTLKLKL